MALSNAGRDAPSAAEAYNNLTRAWTRHLRVYVRSVRLYQRVTGRRNSQGVADRAPPDDSSQRLYLVEASDDDRAPLPTLAARAGEQPGHDRRGPLTRRQIEVAGLIAEGLTNGQIAERLVLTEGTVGNHVGQMLRRLGVKNRAQIAVWSMKQAAP